MRIGVICVKGQSKPRTLLEGHGARMVLASAQRRIGRHIAPEPERSINVGVEVVKRSIRGGGCRPRRWDVRCPKECWQRCNACIESALFVAPELNGQF